MKGKSVWLIFSVSIGNDDELNQDAHELLNQFKANDNETDKAALRALINWAAPLLEDMVIKTNGGDTEGMNAALDTIRQLYKAAIVSKKEIAENRDVKISKMKERAAANVRAAEEKASAAADEMEKAVSDKLDAEETCAAEKLARESAEAHAEAEKNLRIARDEQIADMKDRLNAALASENEKITEAEELRRENTELRRQLTEKEHELEVQELKLRAEYAERIGRLEMQIELLKNEANV